MTLTPLQLAQAYGTPLYVYDLSEIDEAVARLRMALPALACIYYSAKANPHPVLLTRVLQLGCLIEVSSVGELTAAIQAGALAQTCLFSGPGKTIKEVDQSLSRGVKLYSVESIADFRRLESRARVFGVTVDCLIRVNPPASGTTGLRMNGAMSHFGVASEAARDIKSSIGARIVGAHFFALSNASNEESLIAQLEVNIEAAANLGIPIQILDLGGGFAAPFAEPGVADHYPNLRVRLEIALDAAFPHWRTGTPSILFESGRYIVGPSGTLLTSVLDIKEGASQPTIVVDAGINNLGGMGGIGRLARPAATPLAVRPGHKTTASIVGPLCTPADVLGRNVEVSSYEIDDIVEIPNVGAYGLTASLLSFLSREPPLEVIVDSEGVLSRSRLSIVRTEQEMEDE